MARHMGSSTGYVNFSYNFENKSTFGIFTRIRNVLPTKRSQKHNQKISKNKLN